MHLYVKHASYINNCYPEKEGENSPKSSELSYLVFYASSRPVKLTKVGLFLEKKVERDTAKGRKQNNQISLQIIKALIEACHRDLNLFSKYIVKIFKMMLETKDIETMDLTCQVFVIFTSYHDGSTLGIDSEFTKDYEYLLKKFASFCSNDSNETTFNLQMRYIGQKALQAAVTSNALQASNFKVQLDLILLPLIHALSNSKNPANALAQSNNEDLDIREPTIGHETLNAHSVQVLAAKTVALLYSKTNSGTFKLSLNPLFTFMDAEEKWWPPNFVVSMMELVLDSLQSQHRYLLVSEILYQLENVKKATNVEKKDSKQKYASLVSILDIILNANIPLVGISVLEVLNTLFIHLIKSVQEFTSFKDKLSTTSDSDVQDTLQYTIQYGLAHCIGGLASQTYYLNQLNDITSYIISKLKVNHDTLDTIDGLLMKEYRHVVLKCLDLVAKASSSKQAQKEDTESDNENTSLYSNLITLDVWIPALGLLTDKIPETRIEFAEILVDYLEATSENDFTLEPYPKHTLNQQRDVLFVNKLYQSLLDWVQIDNLTKQDMKTMYKILNALTFKFGADSIIKATPLIFQIQDLVKDSIIKQASHQRAVAAIVIEWLMMTGNFYRISSLVEYAEGLKNERIQLNEYSSVFLDQDSSGVDEENDVNRLEELESDNNTLVSVFVDRKKVVDLLSKEGPLRDEDDTDGTDLENKLMVEWGSNVYVNHDRTFRIRTSRNLNDLKAKLTIPWAKSDLDHHEQDEKQAIRVENLKEALSGQLQNDMNHLQSLTLISLAKRNNEITNTDISLLLQSLSLGNDFSPSISLVTPPYK